MSWCGQTTCIVITFAYINWRQCPHCWQLPWKLWQAFAYMHFVSLSYMSDDKGFFNFKEETNKPISTSRCFSCFCTTKTLAAHLVLSLCSTDSAKVYQYDMNYSFQLFQKQKYHGWGTTQRREWILDELRNRLCTIFATDSWQRTRGHNDWFDKITNIIYNHRFVKPYTIQNIA